MRIWLMSLLLPIAYFIVKKIADWSHKDPHQSLNKQRQMINLIEECAMGDANHPHKRLIKIQNSWRAKCDKRERKINKKLGLK